MTKGVPKSEEHKAKISQALKGKPKSQAHIGKMHKPKSEEHKRKLSEAIKGKPVGDRLTSEGRQRLIDINTGSKRSAESRAKMSKSAKGKILSPETKAKLALTSAKAIADGRSGGFKFHKSHPYTAKDGRYIVLKNSWEYGVAVYIDTVLNLTWEYELEVLVLENAREVYLPDFFIFDSNNKWVKIVEVKGRYEPDDMLRMAHFQEALASLGVEWELWDGNKLKELGIIKSVYGKAII